MTIGFASLSLAFAISGLFVIEMIYTRLRERILFYVETGYIPSLCELARARLQTPDPPFAVQQAWSRSISFLSGFIWMPAIRRKVDWAHSYLEKDYYQQFSIAVNWETGTGKINYRPWQGILLTESGEEMNRFPIDSRFTITESSRRALLEQRNSRSNIQGREAAVVLVQRPDGKIVGNLSAAQVEAGETLLAMA